MQIAVLDWIVGAYLLLGAIKGWRKGMVYELMSLGSWFISYFVARQYALQIADLLPLKASAEGFRYAAGFLTCFVLIMLASSIVAGLLKSSLRMLGIGVLDSLLGSVLGSLRNLLILLVLTAVLLWSPLHSANWWSESQSSHWLQLMLEQSKPFWPELLAQKNTV